MASLISRSGSYRVEWRLGGKRGGLPQSCTLPELQLAEAAQALAGAHRHNITDKEVYKAVLRLPDSEPVKVTPTLAEWIETWGENKVDVAPNTHKEYMRLMRTRVARPLGHLRLAEITREHWEGFIRDLSLELKPAGVRKIHVVFHQVLAAAIPKYLSENPAAKPAGKRKNGLPKIKQFKACFLTPSEADMIWVAAHPEAKDFVKTLFGTGMRLSEILNLEVGNLDLDIETPAIRVVDSKSEDGERTVTISRSLTKILRKRTKGKKPKDLVFPAPEGGKWDTHNFRRRYWFTAVAKAGRCAEHPPELVPCGRGGRSWKLDPLSVSDCGCKTRLHKRPRIHDGRHTHVGWLIDAKWDFFAIQKRIGHEDISTTFNTYGKRQGHGDTKRLDALDARLDPTAKRAKKEEAAKRKAAKKRAAKEKATAELVPSIELEQEPELLVTA